MNALLLIALQLAGVAVVARVFFGKRLLWLPVRLLRGLVYLAISSVTGRDRNHWR